MKTTKLKDFKNIALVPYFFYFPPTSLPFFYAFSFTVKKMADFCQKLLLQKHVLSHVWWLPRYGDFIQNGSEKVVEPV